MYSSPFNENTLLVWASQFGIQLFFGLIYAIINVPIATFFVANGLHYKACAHQFGYTFAHMRDILNENCAMDVRLKVKETLTEATDLHNTAKRYR